MSERLIEEHDAWMKSRSRRLSRIFSVEADDVYQSLALSLLKHKSQKTAWLEVVRDLHRESINRPLQELDFNDLHHLEIRDSEVDRVDSEDLLAELLNEDERWAVVMAREGYSQESISRVIDCHQTHVSTLLDSAFEKINRELNSEA